MEHLLTFENLTALFTLTALEIVLGIDNVVFIAILTGKLPPETAARARRIGLALALGLRIVLLAGLTWIMRLTTPLVTVLDHGVTGKDLILLAGGLFLIGKSTYEIHDKVEGSADHNLPRRANAEFAKVVAQVIALDLVFSIDSVVTAIGMARALPVMIAAVVIAVGVMLRFAGPISSVVEQHPTLKMLALAFLLMIGVMLVAEGFGRHIEKGYIYFAMGFSLVVEMLNIRAGRKAAAS